MRGTFSVRNYSILDQMDVCLAIFYQKAAVGSLSQKSSHHVEQGLPVR